MEYYERIPELKQLVNQIKDGMFSPEAPELFKPLVDTLLLYGDRYVRGAVEAGCDAGADTACLPTTSRTSSARRTSMRCSATRRPGPRSACSTSRAAVRFAPAAGSHRRTSWIDALMCGAGFFSSDRTIQEYADNIWNVTPVDCSHHEADESPAPGTDLS